MPDILTDLSPSALAAAVKENLYALDRHNPRSPATESHERDGLYRWRTPVAHPWFNGVICTKPPGADAVERAQGAVEYFRAHRLPAFTWWLAPSLDPAAWARVLLPNGFGFDKRTPGMAITLEAKFLRAESPALKASSLEIRRAEDHEALRVWARTFVAGYEVAESWGEQIFDLYKGMQERDGPIRYYIGYRDENPVATSTMFFGAGVAGIYDVATLPSERGRGFGSAMTLAPLREARDVDYRVGVLQSSPMGLPVYERLGFRTVCTMDHFLWRAANPEGASNLDMLP